MLIANLTKIASIHIPTVIDLYNSKHIVQCGLGKVAESMTLIYNNLKNDEIFTQNS